MFCSAQHNRIDHKCNVVQQTPKAHTSCLIKTVRPLISPFPLLPPLHPLCVLNVSVCMHIILIVNQRDHFFLSEEYICISKCMCKLLMFGESLNFPLLYKIFSMHMIFLVARPIPFFFFISLKLSFPCLQLPLFLFLVMVGCHSNFCSFR